MTGFTQTKDLYSNLRIIIMQQQSGRLAPTRASHACKMALTNQDVNVISEVLAEMIFKLTINESL
ncbi:hypothetical protein K3E65_001803 [Escherichia coli]|nr:hypothetical protein [Escherichia coli]